MQLDESRALYPIGIVAELLDIHPRTLRTYEQEGLIRPARRGGKRFYSNRDVQWLKCLRKLLTSSGLNIPGVKRLLTAAPCWSIRKCGVDTRRHCPAVLDFPVPCWELKPLSCRDRDLSCPACEVYRAKMDYVMNLMCGGTSEESGE